MYFGSTPSSDLLNLEAIVTGITFFVLIIIIYSAYIIKTVSRKFNKLMIIKNNVWEILYAISILVVSAWAISIIIIHILAFFTTSKIDFGNDYFNGNNTITIFNWPDRYTALDQYPYNDTYTWPFLNIVKAWSEPLRPDHPQSQHLQKYDILSARVSKEMSDERKSP